MLFVVLANDAIAQNSTTYNLEQCIEKAKASNPLMKQWTVNRELLKLNYQAAKNEYLPAVEANIRRSYNWGLFIDPATNILSNFSSQVYSGSLYSEVEVFNGGRIYHTIEQNRLLYEASGYDKKAAEMQVALTITKLYYELFSTNQIISNTQIELTRSKNLYTRIKKQIALGLLTKKDELNILTDISQKELNLLSAQGNYRTLLKTIQVNMGLTETENITFDFGTLNNITPESMVLDKIIKDTLSPQIKSYNYQIQASEHSLKAIQAAKYPILSIGGGLTTRSSNLLQTELGTQFSNNLSKVAFFNLKVPIFSKNLNNINIERQKLTIQLLNYKIETLKFNYSNTETSERLELENTIKVYIKYKEQINLIQQQLNLAEKSYELGTITFYEYQMAKNNFIDIQNKMALIKSELLYKKELWEKYL
ncbi:MAG: TolC family protein [Bacteroidetes bacterium]|nr:TolC family protein [Bacteroidota bacterium]